jgi:hypothetical protein
MRACKRLLRPVASPLSILTRGPARVHSIIEIPNDEGGGTRLVRLRAWVIVVSCDYPAAQSVLPFSESTGAHVLCRGCDYHTQHSSAGRPFSFMRAGCGAGNKRAREMPRWKERDWPTLRQLLQRLKEVSATERRREFSKHGLNKLVFAFDPKYIPHVSPTMIAPQDALHLFPDGLLRSEGAWLFYVLFNMGLEIDTANKAIRNYKRLPRDVRSATSTAPHQHALTPQHAHTHTSLHPPPHTPAGPLSPVSLPPCARFAFRS